MFEDLLFSDVFDGRYRDGVKSKATTADVLAYESIHCRVAEVEKAIREERTPETAASAAPAAPSSSTPAETAASVGFGKIPEASKESWEKFIKKTIAAHATYVPDQGIGLHMV